MTKMMTLTAATLLAIVAAQHAAVAADPTKSGLYRATGWVDPVYRGLDKAQRAAPMVAPKTYKPHAYAFRGGWEAGKAIEKRFDLGGKVYERFMAK